MEINQDSVIEDLLLKYPQCLEVFESHGMPCRTCMMVSYSTVGDGAVMHDVNLDELLAELRNCAGRN